MPLVSNRQRMVWIPSAVSAPLRSVAFGVDDAPLQLIFSVRFGRIRVDVKLHPCTAAVVLSTPVVIGRERAPAWRRKFTW